MDLERLIESIAFKLPDLPPSPRKNIFQILGVEGKEINNSKVLAYFFSPEEDHGLGSLFFRALMKIVHEQKEINFNYNSDFTVSTEESTSNAILEEHKRKSIDIVIEADDWVVIIENKLNHFLNNPLSIYHEHKREKQNILGIVLSLECYSPEELKTHNGFEYLNITHFELIEKVQRLMKFGNLIDGMTFFYLNEYFKNIQSHEKSKMDKPVMNNVVSVLVEQAQHVAEIQKKQTEAENFINNSIQEIFSDRGYIKRKDVFHNQDIDAICFWVHPSRDIIKQNHLIVHFELQDILKDEVTNEEVLKYFQDEKNIISYLHFGQEGNASHCQHIARYNRKNFLKPQESFTEEFEKTLDDIFFRKGAIIDKLLELLAGKKLIIASDYTNIQKDE